MAGAWRGAERRHDVHAVSPRAELSSATHPIRAFQGGPNAFVPTSGIDLPGPR